MAYVNTTKSSGLSQASVRRFADCTLTPRFARRLTRGPRRTELSGVGQFRLVTPLISRVKALLSTTKMPSPPTIPTILETIRARYIKPSVELPERIYQVPTPLKTLIAMPRPPSLIKPAITTAIKLAKMTILRKPPVTFRPTGIAPALILQMKAPGGGAFKTTQVKIVEGADPVIKSIYGAGAGAPRLGGKGISLKETDPIVPLTATREGVTITDETVPTFVEAAADAPSPWMKYALLAVGGYILYDSFVKSKPKTRRRLR